MKKVKVMLLSVLVLGVVGGTLAFRAKKQSQCIFINSVTLDPCEFRTCLLSVGFTQTLVPNGGKLRFELTPANFDCQNPIVTHTACRLCELGYTTIGL